MRSRLNQGGDLKITIFRTTLATLLLAGTALPAVVKGDWLVGHRGAAMMFPEHTVEGYTAAAQMGAGIVACDVT